MYFLGYGFVLKLIYHQHQPLHEELLTSMESLHLKKVLKEIMFFFTLRTVHLKVHWGTRKWFLYDIAVKTLLFQNLYF